MSPSPAPLTRRLATGACAIAVAAVLAGCDDLTFGRSDSPASSPSASSPASDGGSDGGGADGSPASAEPARPASSMDLTDEQKAKLPSAEKVMNSTLEVPSACAAWADADDAAGVEQLNSLPVTKPVPLAFSEGISEPLDSGRTVFVGSSDIHPMLFEGEPAILLQLSCRSHSEDQLTTVVVLDADLKYIGEANMFDPEAVTAAERAAGETLAFRGSPAEEFTIDGSSLTLRFPGVHNMSDNHQCMQFDDRCDQGHDVELTFTLQRGVFPLTGSRDTSKNAPNGAFGVWDDDKVRNATLPVPKACGDFGAFYSPSDDLPAPDPERTAWGEEFYPLEFKAGSTREMYTTWGRGEIKVEKAHFVEHEGTGLILVEMSCTAGGTGYWNAVTVMTADGEFLGGAGSTDGPNYQAAIEKDPQVDYAEMRGSEVTSFDGSVITIHAVDIRTVKDPSDAPHAYMGTGTADIELTITPGKGLVITGLTVEAPDPEDSDANG